MALNPRESTDEIGPVQAYAETIRVTFPVGIEENSPTCNAIIANFQGPNPFPVDVIVDKSGIVRYASHEYDPDAMVTLIEELLAE